MEDKQIKRRNSAEGYRMIRRYLNSGKTASTFCRREGVSPACFYLWKRRYLDEFGQEGKTEVPSGIFPISLRESPVWTTTDMELIYPNGVKLRVDSSLGMGIIGQLIRL